MRDRENRNAWARAYRKKHRDKINKYHKERYAGIYASWYSLKRRCNNPNFRQYKDYGGRGITYDPHWEKFENFKKDMGKTFKKGLTLERIDNDGNYCKENCKWATHQEQNRNKRKHIMVKYQGKKITLAEYADLVGMNFGLLRSRYYRGMSMKKVMETRKLSRWNP